MSQVDEKNGMFPLGLDIDIGPMDYKQLTKSLSEMHIQVGKSDRSMIRFYERAGGFRCSRQDEFPGSWERFGTEDFGWFWMMSFLWDLS